MIVLLGVGGSCIMKHKWERWKLGGSGVPWWEEIDCLQISTWDFASDGRGERKNERTIRLTEWPDFVYAFNKVTCCRSSNGLERNPKLNDADSHLRCFHFLLYQPF